MTALLDVRNLCAGYDGAAVVRDLSLTVDPGEVVAMLGPNGAGKSTSLMTIVGALPALSGEIDFDGVSILGKRPFSVARRGLGFVPEGHAVFAGLTTEENLRLGQRGDAGLDMVYEYFPALRELGSRRAGLLSGGEQQMLVIGRALLADPKLLVVDELSLGLAPIIVERILPVLRDITVGLGRALLLVEQHVDLALQISDRVYVLSHGELVLHDRAEALRSDPERLTSAYFAGAHAAST